MRLLVRGVSGLPCLNPAEPEVVEEVGVGAVLPLFKSNATPGVQQNREHFPGGKGR